MAPVRVVAFDLDDTLLRLSSDFVPRYLALLTEHLADHLPRVPNIAQALRDTTKALMAKPGDAEWLQDFFYRDIGHRLNLGRDVLEPAMQNFFETRFQELQVWARPVYGVLGLLARLKEHGYRLVLLTSALFPAVAIDQRLAWAGLDGVHWDWRTAFENVHATKPQVAYYREAAAAVGIDPQYWLMVGNDLDEDIRPAHAAGMAVYWVQDRALFPKTPLWLPDDAPRGLVHQVPRYLDAIDAIS
ncbi:MAG: HAD hydrolase-like protein [Firmicutes bacterium]|nr:HAD hydrolase-like protein [Bacillota bacterium]